MRYFLVLLLAATSAQADTLVASRTIPSLTRIDPTHIAVVEGDVPGALSDPAEAIGMETRVALYVGRPIRPGDLGPPALIERNQPVRLIYRSGALTITAEGRALDRAARGEFVRAMNLESRGTVSGEVLQDGSVLVRK